MYLKNNSKILIMSDLDGTFLNDNSKPAESNIIAAQDWVNAGGMFSFLSGRRAAEIKELIPEYKSIANTPAVVLNGTAIYDYAEDKIIELNTFNAVELRKDVKKLINKYAGTEFIVHIAYDELKYSNNPDEVPSDNWCQAMFEGFPEAIDNEIDYIMNKYSEELFVEYFKGDYFRLANKKASKGNGINSVREYCRRNGTEVTVYAIGDHENDRTVTEAADVFACPSNAIDSIKESSKYVLCSNNEGCVAEFIKIAKNISDIKNN